MISRQLLIRAYKLFDIFALACSFGVATFIIALTNLNITSFSQFFTTRIKVQNFFIVALFFFFCQLLFHLTGIHRSRRLGSKLQEIYDLLKVTTIASSLLLLLGFIFNIILINTTFLVCFWTFSSLLLISSRIIMRGILKQARLKGHNIRQMVIIGTGERAQDFARKIQKSPELGYHIVGFVDDEWEGLKNFNNQNWKLISNLKGFQDLLTQQVVDEVVISLPVKSHYDTITTIVKLCEEQGIIVRFLSDLFDLKIAKSYVDHLEDIPVLTLHSAPIDQWQLMVKRIIDVSISILLLLLCAPFFLAVALLIKIDSPGPIFFIQERVGLNKRRFKLIKFRTMVENAETLREKIKVLNEVTGPVFKIKNDPRLTRVGKWLRKTSIDELPQLINVLKGDMSLVGPRPPLPSEVAQYELKDRRRLSIKPGMTCLWQVSGRSNISFEKWMELDKAYIDNWSLWLDFKILAKTIPAVIRGSGAA